jgi:putative phosphoesterase
MKIGILSDTHDELDRLEKALTFLRDEKVTTLLHCGDLCGPDIIQMMSGFDVRIARGNMDRLPELKMMAQIILGNGRLTSVHQFTLDGYAAAMLHGNDSNRLKSMINSGEYAYVFHGHTHRRRDQMIGRTRVINPGALGGTRWQQRSFCILELTTGEARFVRL